MKRFCASVAMIFIIVCVGARPIWAESAEEWNLKGKEAYRAQNYETAQKYYSKAIEVDPKMEKAFFNRALNYYRMKKYDETRSDLVKALSIEPKDHEAIFYTGLAYFGQGKYTEAYKEFEKAAEIERSPLYLMNAAAARYNASLFHAAIQECKIALRLNPEEDLKFKINELMTKAEDKLKEERQRIASNKRGAVRLEPERNRVVEVKWIQTADTGGGGSSSGGG